MFLLPPDLISYEITRCLFPANGFTATFTTVEDTSCLDNALQDNARIFLLLQQETRWYNAER